MSRAQFKHWIGLSLDCLRGSIDGDAHHSRPDDPDGHQLFCCARCTGKCAAGSRWKLFANTWLVTALNTKGIIFFVAFLPQFLCTTQAVVPQLWILSITIVLLATLNATLYAVFAGTARRILTSPSTQRRFNFAGGSMATRGIERLA